MDNLEKKCFGCKKNLPLDVFERDQGEPYSKCGLCRSKLIVVDKKNVCDICGCKGLFNYGDIKNGIKCNTHKELGMIDVRRKKCIVCK